MATSNPKLLANGLAHHLVVHAILDEATTCDALDKAKSSKIPFTVYVTNNQLITPLMLANAASQGFGVPLFDLNAYDKTLLPGQLLKEEILRRHQVLPLLKRGNDLYLAMADPSNQIALDEIKFNSGFNIYPILVEQDKLSQLLDEFQTSQERSALGDLSDTQLDDLVISSGEEESPEEPSFNEIEGEDAPIVRFVHKVLLDAIKKKASDIHFEPYENSYRIRFRQDGILYEVATPPTNLANQITSRLKVMSQLDISEKRVPQDGRFKLMLSHKRWVDFRISTCPTVGGEKVVMRILDPSSATIGVDGLGYSPKQKELFLKAISRPQGMILVTGPTGSGKTVSLYTAINLLNTAERNISTVEDPVEINIAGINQVNINVKTGLTFATALRAFLRQDPDVIMVGEMRDLETAEIGIKAAQTGHLVLSTLHTNSAPETLTRLANMGVPHYNIATSTHLIIAQRLARQLCSHCKVKQKVPIDELLKEGFKETDFSSEPMLYKAVGCEKCQNGYKGRIGLFEVLNISENISQLIMSGCNSLEIAQQAKQEGMQTLRESGIEKVLRGTTSLEEVNRVTKD